MPGDAQPSRGEQAGPEPRPDHRADAAVAHPGLSATDSSSRAVLQTVESHTAVSPLLITAMRSVSPGSSVQPFLAVVEMSSSTRTACRADWSSGTVGVMRTDSGVQAVLVAVRVTWASLWAAREGVGLGDGDDDAVALVEGLGEGAAAGRASSEPPGHSVTTSQTTSSTTARRRKRRRQ